MPRCADNVVCIQFIQRNSLAGSLLATFRAWVIHCRVHSGSIYSLGMAKRQPKKKTINDFCIGLFFSFAGLPENAEAIFVMRFAFCTIGKKCLCLKLTSLQRMEIEWRERKLKLCPINLYNWTGDISVRWCRGKYINIIIYFLTHRGTPSNNRLGYLSISWWDIWDIDGWWCYYCHYSALILPVFLNGWPHARALSSSGILCTLPPPTCNTNCM